MPTLTWACTLAAPSAMATLGWPCHPLTDEACSLLGITDAPAKPVKFRTSQLAASHIIDGPSAARFFRLGLRSHHDLLARACRELSVDLEIISTEEPFQKALMRIMEKRSRLQ